MKKECKKKLFEHKSVTLLSLALLLTACGGINEDIIIENNESISVIPVTDNDDNDSPIAESPIVVDEGFSFQIINSEKQFISYLDDGDVLDLNILPEFFHIEAVELSSSFLSVSMLATGTNYSINRVEEYPVWTLNSESNGFQGGPGTYNIIARGYSLDAALGDLIGESSITITFQEKELSNQPPAAANDNAEIAANTSFTNIDILLNDTDPDSDTLTVISAQTDIGEVSIVDNQLAYTPPTDYTGDVVVTYSISDGDLDDSATLNIRVVSTVTEVAIQWDKPDLLHNGTDYSDDDIAGYEILYRPVTDVAYQKIFIDDINTLSIEIESLEMTDKIEFLIATVSTEGFYSYFSAPIILDL